MANGDHLLSRSLHVHPVFLLGVAVFLVAFGAILGQTLFAGVSAVLGFSVLTGAVVWIVLASVTMVLGVLRSFEVDPDVE